MGMDKVDGVVEAVGTKFNGSLMVYGKWYNLGKGVKHTAKKGDQVTLELKDWESNGKSGVNVVKVDVLAVPHNETKDTSTKTSQSRDFDKENHGKVKSLFLEALLSNPAVVDSSALLTLEYLNSKQVQDELNKLVESVF